MRQTKPPPAAQPESTPPGGAALPAIALLCTAAGLELTLSAIFVAGRLPRPPALLREFTPVTRFFFYPEREIPLYLAGCAFVVGLTLTAAHFVRDRHPDESAGDAGARSAAYLLAAGVGAAAYAFLMATRFGIPAGVAGIDSPSGATVCIAVTALIVLGQVCIAAKALAVGRRVPALARLLHAPAPPAPDGTEPAPAFRARSFAADLLVAALLFCLVFIPDGHRLAGIDLVNDVYHHINFFIMAPLVAFTHGRALGTDAYAQYGVGWVLVFAALRPVLPVAYSSVFRVLTFVGAVYFAGFFVLLRSLRVARPVAFVTAFAAAYYQLFDHAPLSVASGLSPIMWTYPASTIARAPCDLLFFALIAAHGRSGKSAYWLVACAVVAAAVLIETDTGIYLLGTALAYAVAQALLPAGGMRAAARRFAALAGAGAAVFLPLFLGGLTVASRGTLGSAAFWRGYLECLVFYPGGMSMLPIQPQETGVAAFLLWGSYLAPLGVCAVRLFGGRASQRDVLVGCVCLYGLATTLYFVGRSHPANLYHVLMPLFLLFGITAGGVLSRWYASASASLRAACAVAAGVAPLLALLTDPSFQAYPSLLRPLVPIRAGRNPYQYAGRVGGAGGDVPYGNIAGTNAPDALLAPALAPFSGRFAAAVRAVAERGARGERVLIISQEDTQIYVAADIAPVLRYAPLLPLLSTNAAVERLENSLVGSRRPDAIFVIDPLMSQSLRHFNSELVEPLRGFVRRHYRFVGKVGYYEVYEALPAGGARVP